MNSKNSISGYLMLTTFLCSLAFFSCKKEAAEHPSKNDLTVAARNLEGTKLAGSITIIKEENESAIIFNSADKLVIIGVPESKSLHAGTIESAELIVSKFGVVVKDASKNEVWLLPNGDEESKRKFETMRASFPNANYNATIFDVIEINTGKK